MQSRVVFLGTPDFAVPSLDALLQAADIQVVGVVTQPDRPAGRGQAVRVGPVKALAERESVPVIQPEKVREPAAMDQIRAWQPDFLVVVAFGQILRQDLLDLPAIAPINVHASLLPRWRGAAPIQAAIRAGDTYTGVTTMVMDAGLDTGPILLQDSIPIASQETAESLHDKLAALGANLLIHTLRWLRTGSIAPHPQPADERLITYAPQLKKEDGEIDWTQSASEIDRHVRAFTPWPGTYTHWNDRRLKIIAGRPLPVDLDLEPGDVAATAGTSLATTVPVVIGTGRHVYTPTQLQLAGRLAVGAADFLNGLPEFIGSKLGSQEPQSTTTDS
ncbi:MAG: methionyl-tRNA formyltransferase [Chloroflexi bacterium]|nr:methionyl-tRNA formyltransferase [Chloroflexota bacterium]